MTCLTAKRCSLQLHNACLSSLACAKPPGLEALSCSGRYYTPCAGAASLSGGKLCSRGNASSESEEEIKALQPGLVAYLSM